jgi:hypothetical protein
MPFNGAEGALSARECRVSSGGRISLFGVAPLPLIVILILIVIVISLRTADAPQSTQIKIRSRITITIRIRKPLPTKVKCSPQNRAPPRENDCRLGPGMEWFGVNQ